MLYALDRGFGDSNRGRDYLSGGGAPVPGRPAPPVRLPSTTGQTYNLTGFKGKEPVLLFFQDGLTCASCWDQLAAIQQDASGFSALGIGSIASIAVAPLDLLVEKVRDERITVPVLADTAGKVTAAYDAGASTGTGKRPGRSFVLVGRDGRILWRADYAAPPRPFALVPVRRLLDELREALGEAS